MASGTTLDLERVRTHYGAPYIVMHRHDLLQVILEHCRREPTLTLETTRDVTTVDHSADHVTVTCRDGLTYWAEVLLGADGLSSTVRPLVVDDRLQPTGYVAYRGAVPVDAVDRRVALDEVVAWMGPGMHLVQYALRRDRRWPMQDRLPVPRWSRGRVTLLGDAAHPMLLYLAQGACQAIEDAAALAGELARLRGPPARPGRPGAARGQDMG